MICTLEWSGPDPTEWDAAFGTIRRSTLLQSRAYADALCPAMGQRPLRALIRIDSAVAGLVQLQEAALIRRAIHAVILDRGPLWCEGFGSPTQIAAFFTTLCEAFPQRPGRRRRLLPEVPLRQRDALAKIGDMKRVLESQPYQTIWCDLTGTEAALRARLKPKWRNMLSKAERGQLQVHWDWSGSALSMFLGGYTPDKQAKGYAGASPKTLTHLAKGFAPQQAMGIAHVRDPAGDVLAGVLIFIHGSAATYQAGWVTEAGRDAAANHLALWDTLCQLRSRGVTDLDLGGVNDAAAAGVKRFKSGLGGELVELAGQFR